MTKVAINKCYGGFSLSPKGIEHFLKLKGESVTFYDRQPGIYNLKSDYLRIDKDSMPERAIFGPVASRKDLGEKASYEALFADGNYVSSHDWQRDDPDLIRTIEEIGEEADGAYASLAVVEVPDDVQWSIEEYDGIEWVAEQHRTWS